MKRTILAIAAASLLVVSCNPDLKYTSKPFVYFDNNMITVAEDAGTVRVPVSVINLSREVQVGYELVTDVPDYTQHFSLANPDNTILTFSPSNTNGYIEVNIVNEPGVRAAYTFTLNLVSKSTGVEFGGFSSCKVNISDNDHPLKDIIGGYTATDKNGSAWTMTLLADPDDDKNVIIDGLTPVLAGGYVEQGHMWAFKASVSADRTLRVSIGSKLPEAYDDVMPELLGISLDGSFVTGGSIEFKRSETGFNCNTGAYLGIIDWKAGRIIDQVDYTEPPITLVKK